MAKQEKLEEEKIVPPSEPSELVVDEYVDSGVKPYFFRPSIICGICEHCGSIEYVGGDVTQRKNKDGEAEYDYKGGKWQTLDATECKHYKGLQIRCTYCGEQFTGLKTKLGKFAEILATRIVYVMSFVDQPKKVVMYCDSFECKEKHIRRMHN